MDKNLIIQYIPITELLFFNLLSIYRCCQRKYSARRTIAVIAIFSVSFFIAAYAVFGSSIFRGDGSLYFGGLLYLIPFHFLFKEKFSLLLTIVCSCCIYTLGVLSLAIQTGRLIAPEQPVYIAAAATLYYLITIYPFYGKIIPKYIFAIENITVFEQRWFRTIAVNSCLTFATLTLLNSLLVNGEASFLKILVMLLALTGIFISYYMFYKVIRDALQMQTLKREARHDPLTGLYNRTMLWEDLTELVSQGKSFSLLFMDLDRFKQINDQYSHITGDHYLRHFARLSTRSLDTAGRLYRFGGDEFIAVCPGTVSGQTADKLRECPDWNSGAPCPFNGVSIGILPCEPPFQDAEYILRKVDRLMYEQKLRKKTGVPTGPQSELQNQEQY